MSKELEALRNIQANTYYVDRYGNEQHVYLPDDAQFELIRKALTKLDTIELLVDKKRFNTNDIELLRVSIIEVLERDDDE